MLSVWKYLTQSYFGLNMSKCVIRSNESEQTAPSTTAEHISRSFSSLTFGPCEIMNIDKVKVTVVEQAHHWLMITWTTLSSLGFLGWSAFTEVISEDNSCDKGPKHTVCICPMFTTGTLTGRPRGPGAPGRPVSPSSPRAPIGPAKPSWPGWPGLPSMPAAPLWPFSPRWMQKQTTCHYQ